MNQPKVVHPEVPPEVERRRPTALTHLAAEDGSAEERDGLTDGGKSGHRPDNSARPLSAHNARLKANAKAKKLRDAFNKLIAANPHQGLTVPQIQEISGKSYPGQPKMDPTLGDRTPAFVDWLCEHHPKDAAVRFAYRDICPGQPTT